MRLTCRHQGLLGATQEFALNYAVFKLRTYGSEAPFVCNLTLNGSESPIITIF